MPIVLCSSRRSLIKACKEIRIFGTKTKPRKFLTELGTTMENGFPNKAITTEDVISKLKDDGDFDRLRLKIIREAKDNEDLRSSIISVVKQSTALNCPGAENMKPRQLSDAIHQEVGDKVMSQISESLWNIIRSQDGMKKEIVETVESVYDKLLNPVRTEDIRSSSPVQSIPTLMHLNNNNENCNASNDKVDDPLDEPPGFFFQNHEENKKQTIEEQRNETNESTCMEQRRVQDSSLSTEMQCDGNDNDPDVPPGFG